MKPAAAAGGLLLLFAASALHARGQHALPTLDKVRAAHELACGIVQEDAEYSTEDDHSSRGGFDSALCQAFAIAADARAAVKVTSFLDEQTALDALRAGTLDVIATVSAEPARAGKDVRFSRAVFYDSLALLVPVSSGLRSTAGVAGKKICVLAETGTEEALRTWFAQRHLDYLPFPFQEDGNCAALAAERTRLSSIRLSLGESAAQHALLPEALSRDAMAAATSADDAQWSRIVDLVAGTLLLAGQLGLGAANIDPAPNSRAGSSWALLEPARLKGTGLGLRPTWVADVLRVTGNYGQMYERTLGSGSERKLPRDLNRTVSEGGLLTPGPVEHPYKGQ